MAKVKAKPIHLPDLTLSLDEGAGRVAECVWYAGASVPYYPFDQVTFSLEPGACDMSRFESGAAPVLLNHDRFDVRSQVGVISEPRIDGGQAKATLRFTDREDFAGLWQDVKAGIIRNISMGCLPLEIREVVNENTALRLGLVTRWQPYEISLVAVPQDQNARITMNADSEIEVDIIELTHQEATMPNTGVTDAATLEQTRAAAAAAERERVLGIQQRGQRAGVEMALIDQHITSGSTLEAACLAFIDAQAARQQPTIPSPAAARAEVTRDQFDSVQMGLANALDHRVIPGTALDAGRQYHGMTLLQMAACLSQARTGRRIEQAPPALMYEAIQMNQHGTADFPLLLAATANKRLRRAYDEAKPSYLAWTKSGTAKDFKTISSIGLGEFGNVPELPEGATITRATIGESREQWAVISYGMAVSITRQAIINDDLRALNQTIPRLGNAAARTRNAVAYAKLTANGAMSDSVALFHATHANLGTAGVISNTTLTEARKLMRLQKGINTAVTLDIIPRFMLIPVELEVTASSWLNAATSPTQVSEVNFHFNKLQIVSDPQLSLNSATAWYMAADPAQVGTIEVTTLEGYETPRVATQNGWLIEGVDMKILDDFGVGVEDYRGLLKNAGA